MNKLFVLDTNILIADPEALFKFGEHDVCIPIVVLEELNNLKTRDLIGGNARQTSRVIDALRAKGRLSEGVSLGDGKGKFFVVTDDVSFSFSGMKDTSDNAIIGTALRLIENDPMRLKYGIEYGQKVILVTNDVNVAIKADCFGIISQQYRNDRVKVNTRSTIREASCDLELIDDLYNHKLDKIPVDPKLLKDLACPEQMPDPNTPYIFSSHCLSRKIMMKYRKGAFYRLRDDSPVSGVKPRNAEQRFLLDALMNNEIDLIVCNGVAGSGKTLLSLAAGLELIQTRFDRILFTKTIMPVGRDIGYTTGDKEEKMAEWIKPFHDNLEFLARKSGTGQPASRLFKKDEIEIEALTYVRGRSLMKRFVIVDECQNLTPGQVKTIVSRVADSSKLILLGDIQQIDNHYLNSGNCGLAHALDKLRGFENVAVFNLVRSERGRIASLAVKNL